MKQTHSSVGEECVKRVCVDSGATEEQRAASREKASIASVFTE